MDMHKLDNPLVCPQWRYHSSLARRTRNDHQRCHSCSSTKRIGKVTDLENYFIEFYPREISPIHLTDPGIYVTCTCMTIALAGCAVSSVWS